MSTQTPRLGLITNTDTDPFQLSDFTNNWNTLEANPGTFVCTSGTRPAWGSAQRGRRIIETDTHRELQWTGTTFQEPILAPGTWKLTMNPNTSLGSNANVNYTLGTINVLRPAILFQFLMVRVGTQTGASSTGRWAATRTLVDGAQTTDSGRYGYAQWSTYSTAASVQLDWRDATVFSVSAVSPGNHTVGANVTTNATSGSANNVSVGWIDGFYMLVSSYGGAVTS